MGSEIPCLFNQKRDLIICAKSYTSQNQSETNHAADRYGVGRGIRHPYRRFSTCLDQTFAARMSPMEEPQSEICRGIPSHRLGPVFCRSPTLPAFRPDLKM